MTDPLSRRSALARIAAGSVAPALPLGAVAAAQTAPAAGAAPGAVAGGPVTPHAFGALPDAGDVTARVQAMLGAMGGKAPGARYTSHWPYGIYPVTQVRFDLQGAVHSFDGAMLSGIATTRTPSIVDLRGGNGWYRGLRVAGGFRPHYECGVHHYTNDSATHYPGYLDVVDLQVEAVDIGLVIGALPSQRTLGVRDTRVADDQAIDAPLSESIYTNPRFGSCPRGVLMRQPNGKVTIIGGRINSESQQWKGYDTTRTFAVAVVDPGSELTLIGGTLEHVQGGDGGHLALVTGGKLVVSGAVVETTVPIYLDGDGSVHMEMLANNGVNSRWLGYLEVGAGATGSFSMSNSMLAFPPGHIAITDAAPMIRSVQKSRGPFRPNPEFIADFTNVEFRDPPLAMGGNRYVPLARGVQARFRGCSVSSYDVRGKRVQRMTLDDGPDLLAGRVDRSAASILAFPQAGQRESGGWTLRESGGGEYGRVDLGGQAIPGTTATAALRLNGNGGRAIATSPRFPVKRDGLSLLRGFLRTGDTRAPIAFRLRFSRFDGSGATTAETVLFAGEEREFGSAWQPLMLAFVAPADAEYCEIEIETGAGADLQIAAPEVR